jgi:hypothetical protein
MWINLSRSQVEKASSKALVVITSKEAFVVERVEGGGIDDKRIEQDCSIFPVTMVKEFQTSLPGGDWTVVPFVRCDGRDVESSADYRSFSVEWVDI